MAARKAFTFSSLSIKAASFGAIHLSISFSNAGLISSSLTLSAPPA
jgi:hypothetical protein